MNKFSPPPLKKQHWGLLPAQVKSIIKRREWDNTSSLKARLLGLKTFPLRFGLKPPNGRSAITDMAHFQNFVTEWKLYPHQHLVQWSSKKFRDLSEQLIPTFLVIDSFQDLVKFLGDAALARSNKWQKNMMPLLQVNKQFYPALVKHIGTIEKLSLSDAELLAKLIPQLKRNMGQGQYLRALPLTGIDTKFLESHQDLLEELLNIIYQGIVSDAGGLVSWLGCSTNPKGWLTIRPLCHSSRVAMGTLPILQIPGSLLKEYELPATNILVVENLQSGLALPEMDNTIAVIGGGKNIAWMDALWLKSKRVGYWGDIDSWGLSILSDVRARFKDVEPIMMDVETLKKHEDRMVLEPEPAGSCPLYLNETEALLFNDLVTGKFQSTRLEQERLAADYIRAALKDWLSGT